MSVADALDYYATATITSVKRFMVQAPDPLTCGLYYKHVTIVNDNSSGVSK